MPPSKILLTGSSGFVGSHVIKQLKNDFTLYAISTKATANEYVSKTYAWNEINNIEESFDAVIHMAGLAHDTQNKNAESAYFEVNVGLTEKLLENISNWNCSTFIYISSVKAAVDSTANHVLTEEMPSTASNVYGRSKLKAEQVIMNHNNTIDRIILRPVMVYGRAQKGNLITLEKWIRKGLWFPFKQWKNKRSVLSVNNLSSVIKTVVKNPIPSGVYFISDDRPVSTSDILKSIGKGINRKVRLIPVPNWLIKLGLAILPNKIKAITDKVLGSLEVDNSKLKSGLGITEMPYKTEIELPASFSPNNLTTQNANAPKR